jgi:hypothetical protein
MDIFEHRGRMFSIRLESDDSSDAPWDNQDTLGEVSGWTTRNKAPGERILVSDRFSRRLYDFAGAVAKGRAEGLSGPKAAEVAVAEYDYHRRWCNDQWCYIGVVVTLLDDDDEPTDETESLWGIESDAEDYHVEVARELADEILARVPVRDYPRAFVPELATIGFSLSSMPI